MSTKNTTHYDNAPYAAQAQERAERMRANVDARTAKAKRPRVETAPEPMPAPPAKQYFEEETAGIGDTWKKFPDEWQGKELTIGQMEALFRK